MNFLLFLRDIKVPNLCIDCNSEPFFATPANQSVISSKKYFFNSSFYWLHCKIDMNFQNVPLHLLQKFDSLLDQKSSMNNGVSKTHWKYEKRKRILDFY